MVSDRNALVEGGRDLPWWQSGLLTVAAPVQRLIAAPVDGMRGVWRNYVSLLELREENERLRQRIEVVEEENLQFREALVASALPRCATTSRSRCCPARWWAST
jgi:cell shape-determining protein MreC